MRQSAYLRVVESIYDAALERHRWRDAITHICDGFDSTAAGFFVESEAHELQEFFFVGLDPDQITLYGEQFAKINPWFTTPGLMRPGYVRTDRSLERAHNNPHAFLKSAMYQDWCARLEFRHAMGGTLLDRSGQKINFTFFRPSCEGHYTQAEILHYQRLCRHLIKATELNAEMQDAMAGNAIRDQALNCLRIGVVLLNTAQRVSFVNDYARTLLSPPHGLCIAHGRLSATQADSANQLSAALNHAYRQRRAITVTLSRPSGAPLSISIVPENAQRTLPGLSELHAAVLITDPDDRTIGNADYLAQRWQLTPLEARFCEHLLRGRSTTEIAHLMGLTDHTTQWYLKQIRGKLGVKRQSALVAALMGDLGLIRLSPDR